jgi:multidrug efflux pump subunit AcrA (membrane-fusion protein)
MRARVILFSAAVLAVPMLLSVKSTLTPVVPAQKATESVAGTLDRATRSLPAATSAPQVITVESRRIGATTVLGGTVIPYREVALTAQGPGRVVFLAGEEGDSFEAGQVVAALDKDELLASRAAAIAELRNAQDAWRAARAETWRQYYAGNEPLQGMGSWQALDQWTGPFRSFFGDSQQRYGPAIQRDADVYEAQARAEQAATQIRATRARIEQIDARLRDTDSVAPFSGVITKKLVEVGDTVQPGQPLLRIADMRRLQVQVEVPARIVSGLKLGMTVPVRLDVGDGIIDAHVAQIFPMADVQRHTVTVKLDLPAEAPAAPGMYAEALVPDISMVAAELPVVPASAVVWRGSLPAVFALRSDNQPELRMVRVGDKLGHSIVILSGLNAGERVLIHPAPGLASS